MTYEGLEIVIVDRQAAPGTKPICTIRNVFFGGFSGGAAAKQLSEVRIPFKGTRIEDESGTNEEDPMAAKLIGKVVPVAQ
jgi:hypothetical protein